jgi:tRNA(Ile)-lysidine synthase
MKTAEDISLQVRRTIRTFRMLRRGDCVVVAVSGGADSVALLYLLWELRHSLGIDLQVAHLDHGLRGQSSGQDARYVRRLAGRLDLPITVERAEIPARPEGGLEEAARRVRYDFLHRVAARQRAQRIATGHTADDQAETVLMRLIRGAGSEGLGGIPPVRGVIVRPLIQVRREQIMKYLKRHRLRPRQDRTNRQLHLVRNRVRWELIPLLKRSYNPNIVGTLNRIADLEREEGEYFRQLSQTLIKRAVQKVSKGKIILDLSRFGDYFIIGQKYLIRELIRSLKGDLRHIESRHLDGIVHLARRGSVGSRITLPQGLVVERGRNILVFMRGVPSPFCQELKVPGITRLPEIGWTCRARLVKREKIPWPPREGDEYQAFLDWARMHGPFVLRSRRPGDRFQPLGMRGTRKLTDYFIDRKIPKGLRDEIPLLVSGDDIIWVVGCGIADPFKVTGRTASVLWARCSRRQEV